MDIVLPIAIVLSTFLALNIGLITQRRQWLLPTERGQDLREKQ